MSLDLETSTPLADLTQIPSLVANPADAHLASASTEGAARIIWFEAGRIRSAYLSSSGQLGDTKDLLPGTGKSILLSKGRKYSRIIGSVGRSKGYILGQREGGAVDVVDVRRGGSVVDTFESSVSYKLCCEPQ
jgi:hypothetical protein